jgi:hypothetical protein
VDENLLRACEAKASDPNLTEPTIQQVREAAETWAERITLPGELRGIREQFVRPLARLICQGKVCFYEPQDQQGGNFDLSVEGSLRALGNNALGERAKTQAFVDELLQAVNPILDRARRSEGEQRDQALSEMRGMIARRLNEVQTDKARGQLGRLMETIRSHEGSRGGLPRGVSLSARRLVESLNSQPEGEQGQYEPSLTIVIGEGEASIVTFARQVIERAFEDRRTRSLLYPIVSFVFDEADVFISQDANEGNVVEQATLLARRGRKFGLGLGIATQRIRYLNTSIMAQPHTYFISKLPRKSDREAVAEAFAIAEESLEQSFSFSTGQWLVASHDATGLRGTPFPVQLPNANDSVRQWLEQYHRHGAR